MRLQMLLMLLGIAGLCLPCSVLTPALPIPTRTVTPAPADLTLSGSIYDGRSLTGIADAVVAVTVCVPRSFTAVTDAQGRYRLILPAAYLQSCDSVTLRVSHPAIVAYRVDMLVRDLRDNPIRDFYMLRKP